MDYNVTVVVNAHREGNLCKATLESLSKAKAYAGENGVSVEIVAVLDRVDDVTQDCFKEHFKTAADVKILKAEFGDLGKSRNYGVKQSSGEWVSFLDADDLFSKSWLANAFIAAKKESRTVVWHPEKNLYFGKYPHIFKHIDMDSRAFRMSGLAVTNYWTALCFAERSLLLSQPYPETKPEEGVGFEDWSWNIRTISEGVIHKIVPSTFHAIRMKNEGSLLQDTVANASLPHSSDLFVKAIRGVEL